MPTDPALGVTAGDPAGSRVPVADIGPVTVLVTDLGASEGWEPALRSLFAAGHDLTVTVVVPKAGTVDRLRLVAPELREIVAHSVSDAVAELRYAAGRSGTPLLMVSRPAIVPAGFLGPAGAILAADLRVATVGFLTNDADYLSFPHRNTPNPHQVERLDERGVTRRLRERGPVLRAAPVPLAVGPMTLLAAPALDALGVLPDAETGEGFVAAVSVAAQRKGFLSVVDLATFYSTPRDSGRLLDAEDVGLRERRLTGQPGTGWQDRSTWSSPREVVDIGNLDAVIEREEVSVTSAFAVGHRAARAKVMGLRVGIDGSCLGPNIMGTQVQTLAIIDCLARHDEVSEVVVTLPGTVPTYAEDTFVLHKVRAVAGSDVDVSAVGAVDVFHRPFQPQRSIDFDAWRLVAHRTAVSILDVIAYRNGAYHGSGESWLGYRDAVDGTLARVDGATVISADVKQQMLDERLPIDGNRVFVVELGTDHMTGGEIEHEPVELLERGFTGEDFLVVLGASYAHKNRDQAIRAVKLLREQGRDLHLVLVGAAVPHGSSRRLEAMALGAEPADWLWTIPDVANEERNWLLRHSLAVLYPTSAEGFGFVPFEAARFGTPTLCVPFGPLVELAPDLSLVAEGWDEADLAAAVERVLSDPALARAQVAELLRAGTAFTWSRTADKLVAFYGELLAAPRR